MRFSTYLNENKNLMNEATLVLHKIIYMVDGGHVDINDNDIRFYVGPMIHKGAYNKVKVVIRKGPEILVRLGRIRDTDEVAIVVDTKELPARDKIDTLLSEKEIFDGFVSAFVAYLTNIHDHNGKYEKHASELEIENSESFEDNYNELIKSFQKENIETYKKAVEELESHVNNNANMIKSETTKLSIKNLQKEYLGTNEQEFLSIIKKNPLFKKFEYVQKEKTEKLTSRLKTYFASVIKPMLDN